MFVAKCLIAFIVIVISFGAHARTASVPSFNCAKATHEVEKNICSNPQLAFADQYLNAIYQSALKLHPEKRKEIESFERKWLTDYRNDLCVKGDFSWFVDAEMFAIDDPLLKCYKIQIHLLQSNYQAQISDEFIEGYSNLMVDEYADYNQQFIEPVYSKEARRFVARKTIESSVKGYLNAESYFFTLVFADNHYLSLDRSIYDAESGQFQVVREFYCLQDGVYQPVGNYWACAKVSGKASIFDAMKNKINQIDLQAQLKLIEKYEAGTIPAENDETRLVAVLVNFPFLAYDHRAFYTSQAMAWIDDNKKLLMPLVKQHKVAAIDILNSMLRLNQMIEESPDGVAILRDSGSSAYKLSERLAFDDYTAGEPVAKTLYNLQEVYLHVWAQLYLHGGAERAKLTIQHLIEALESDNQ